MDDEKVRKIKSMISDLRFIEENCVSGVDENNLRRTAVALREIREGHLASLWREAGFPKNPMIKARSINSSILEVDAYAIVFNAQDHNPTDQYENTFTGHQRFGPIVYGTGADGISRRQPNGIMSDYLESNKYYDFDKVFLEKSLPIADYFQQTVIYYHGLKINRHDILAYVAYHRYGVHYANPTKKATIKQPLLDEYSRIKEVQRDTIYTLYLGIAQNIVQSEDVMKFRSWCTA